MAFEDLELGDILPTMVKVAEKAVRDSFLNDLPATMDDASKTRMASGAIELLYKLYIIEEHFYTRDSYRKVT